MRSRGFTIIELIVTIVILAILAGVLIAVINPIQMSKQARDVTRKADVAKIASVLEQYFADNSAYPSSLYSSTCPASGALKSIDGNTTYLPKVPCDPHNSPYNSGGYYYTSNNTSCYVLASCLEDAGATGSNVGNAAALNNAVSACSGAAGAAAGCDSGKYYMQTNQ